MLQLRADFHTSTQLQSGGGKEFSAASPSFLFWLFGNFMTGTGEQEGGKSCCLVKCWKFTSSAPPQSHPPGPLYSISFLAPKLKRNSAKVFGSQEFIVCQLRNLFVAVNLQFFRRCQVAQPKHPHVRVLQVRFPFDFYFVSKLQLFGNCFYNTTKTLKGRRRASAAAVGWLRWGWRRWGAENGHRSSKGKCQK